MISFLLTGCELLKIVLHKHSNLLTISNKRGLKVIDLLQELWNYSSKTEREIGDNVSYSLLCPFDRTDCYSRGSNHAPPRVADITN